MTRTHIKRRTAGIILATLALGAAAPAAGARPYYLNQNGTPVPAGSTVPVAPPQAPAQSIPEATGHDAGGGISDWGYVAIGSGAASVAFVGIGAGLAASRRRLQQRALRQPRIAA